MRTPARVVAAAATLSREQWQFRAQGRRKAGVLKRDAKGDDDDPLVDGACIFLNRPGHPGGAGRALHARGDRPGRAAPSAQARCLLAIAAAPRGHRRRERARDKLARRVEAETRGEGGGEFSWWCTESPSAFSGREPVYLSLRDELVAMVGDGVYDLLAAYLRAGKGEGCPCSCILPFVIVPSARGRGKQTRLRLTRAGASPQPGRTRPLLLPSTSGVAKYELGRKPTTSSGSSSSSDS